MKKLITTLALSVATLSSAAYAGELTKAVEVPVNLSGAVEIKATHDAILKAATEVCGNVHYTGQLDFYRKDLDAACVKDTFKDAVAQLPQGEVVAEYAKESGLKY